MRRLVTVTATALRIDRYKLLVMFVTAIFGLVFMTGDSAQATVRLSLDMHDQGETITNKFAVLNSWYYEPEWTSQAAGISDDYMSRHFPFIETVHLMTATGGSLTRDLFQSNWTRNTHDDYDFEPLKKAIRQVINKGLQPYIKTGNVPLKLSDRPVIGSEFGVNVRPPADYDVYYDYIKALAEDMVAEFGIDEVSTWMWGVLTEYENKDWYDAGDPELTKEAYFKLYDYTVAALEEALGPDNVDVGAHSMSVIRGYWDERDFLEHVATGINYKTGEQGSRLNFLAVSFYDGTLIGLDHVKLINTIDRVRNKAEELGLTDLRYGIDEGRLLSGWDSKPLTSRAVNMSAQGAADAKLFKVMLDHDIDWFASWGLTTERFWGGANAIGSNVANLVYRMVGDVRVAAQVDQPSIHRQNDVNGIASYDPDTQTLRLLVYNNSSSPVTGRDDDILVTIQNVRAVQGDTVIVERWRVDDDHANWWPTWLADQAARGLTDDDYTDWSRFSVEIPRVLRHQADRDYWRSREATYIELGTLTSSRFELDVANQTMTLQDDIPAYGVAFYEIVGVAPGMIDASTSGGTAGDERLGLYVSEEGIVMKDGEPFSGYGVNYFNLFYRTLLDPSDTSYREGLALLSQYNIPFVRFMASGFWPTENALYFNDKERYFELLDQVVAAAEEYGIGLIPSLFWHASNVTDLMDEPQSAWGNPESKTHAHMRTYVQEVVSRYVNSAAIWGWEFGNEYNLGASLPNASEHRPPIWPTLGTRLVRGPEDDLTHEMIHTAFRTFAEEVRAIDPHRMITSGDSMPRPSEWHQIHYNSWQADTVEQFGEIVEASTPDPMDVISVHVYDVSERRFGDTVFLPRVLDELMSVSKRINKPVFVGEFGAGEHAGHESAERTFHAILNSLVNAGVRMAALWVYDFDGQEGEWNIAPHNNRMYQLEALKGVNDQFGLNSGGS